MAKEAIITATDAEQAVKNYTPVKWAVLGLYATLMVFGLSVHEPWADEAQAWLLARDASIPELFRRLAEEYHPPLWYFLLLPLAKAGSPYWTIKLLPAAIMTGAAYFTLFKTRLPIYLQLLVPFCYYFFYEYSVVARNYCLIAFFAAAIAALYPKRYERPWLFALCVIGLFNSHVLAFSFAISIAGLFLLDAIQDKKQNIHVIGAFVTMCIGGLYLLPFMGGSSHITHFYAGQITSPAEQAQKAMSNSMLIDSNIILGVVLFLVCSLLLAGRTKSLLLLLAGCAGTLYIVSVSYTSVIRHQGVLFIIMLCCYAISYYYNDDKWNFIKDGKTPLTLYGSYLLTAIILIQLPASFKAYKADVEEPFSGSKDAADFLLENNLAHKTLSGHQGLSAVAVMPYLPSDVKCYFPESNKFGTYYVYDSSYVNGNMLWNVDYAVKVTHDRFAGQLDKVIFIFNHPIQERTNKFLELLYANEEEAIHREETYYIYKFKDEVK